MKILIALNDVVEDKHLIDFYANNISNLNHQPILIKVFEQPKIKFTDYYPGPITLTEDIIFEFYRRQKEAIDELKKIATENSKIYNLHIEAKLLDPGICGIGEAIVIYSKTIKANMIIISSSEKSSLTKFIIGSTSKYIVHNSKIPVCICPKK